MDESNGSLPETKSTSRVPILVVLLSGAFCSHFESDLIRNSIAAYYVRFRS